MIKKHRDNLTKLADYLAALPADYEQFDMNDYNRVKGDNWKGGPLYIEKRRYDCDTVACAIGHGPAAGIRVYGDMGWNAYCIRVFGIDRWDHYDTFQYLFGPNWIHYDNTPQGAAERIRIYLESGVPEDWGKKRTELRAAFFLEEAP